MKHRIIVMLAAALLICAGAGNTAGAAGMPVTPMVPGFHQRVPCDRGYVAVEVATADPRIAAHVSLVTTTIAVGRTPAKTRALRAVDARGNIYAFGYVIGAAVKRFPARLLFPASPPAPGERSSYFTLSGLVIEKRFEGTKAGGYVFSDYLAGRKLNTVTYIPAVGIAAARFFGLLPDGRDLVCAPARP